MKKDYVLRVVPRYAVLPLISSFAFNMVIYAGTMKLCAGLHHYDFTTAFDRAVPLIPAFTSVYLICYLFWAANYIMIARIGKEHMYRFLVGDYISRIVCGLFYVFLPTTLIRPEILGDGFWDQMLKLVYTVDSSANLFPSIHCLVSWFCYIGIRGRENIPKAYRAFSCIFALLVCVSTQLTKQHYIIDAFGGISIAELTYWLAFHTQAYRGPKRVFDWLYRGIFNRQGKISRKEGEA